ncbi:hypothetical protein EMIT0111MI5_80015 [Burkholderia sp. IT-111MI5]
MPSHKSLRSSFIADANDSRIFFNPLCILRDRNRQFYFYLITIHDWFVNRLTYLSRDNNNDLQDMHQAEHFSGHFDNN